METYLLSLFLNSIRKQNKMCSLLITILILFVFLSPRDWTEPSRQGTDPHWGGQPQKWLPCQGCALRVSERADKCQKVKGEAQMFSANSGWLTVKGEKLRKIVDIVVCKAW